MSLCWGAPAATMGPPMQRPPTLTPQAPWTDRGPDVTVLTRRVPCLVTAHWTDGTATEHDAIASAWTPRAVEVYFTRAGASYRVWLPVANVRRVTAGTGPRPTS